MDAALSLRIPGSVEAGNLGPIADSVAWLDGSTHTVPPDELSSPTGQHLRAGPTNPARHGPSIAKPVLQAAWTGHDSAQSLVRERTAANFQRVVENQTLPQRIVSPSLPTGAPPARANFARVHLQSSYANASKARPIPPQPREMTASPITPPIWSQRSSPDEEPHTPPATTEGCAVQWDKQVVRPVADAAVSIPHKLVKEQPLLPPVQAENHSWLQSIMHTIQGGDRDELTSSSGSSHAGSGAQSPSPVFSRDDSSESEDSSEQEQALLHAALNGRTTIREPVPPLSLGALGDAKRSHSGPSRTREGGIGVNRSAAMRSTPQRRHKRHNQVSNAARQSPKTVESEVLEKTAVPRSRGGKRRSDAFAEAYAASHVTDDDLTNMALYLGIEPDQEQRLLWIAEEALHAPLPEGWQVQVISLHDPSGTQAEGRTQFYFHSSDPKNTQWEHPLDEFYRSLVRETRGQSQTLYQLEDEELLSSDASGTSSASPHDKDSPSWGDGMYSLVVGSARSIFDLLSPRSAAVRPLNSAEVHSTSVDQSQPSTTGAHLAQKSSVDRAQSAHLTPAAPHFGSNNLKLQEVKSALDAESQTTRELLGHGHVFDSCKRPWGIALAIQESYKAGIAVSYAQEKYTLTSLSFSGSLATISKPYSFEANELNAKLCCAGAAVLPPNCGDLASAAAYLDIPLVKIAAFDSAWVCKALLFARVPFACTIIDEDSCFELWAAERMRLALQENFAPDRECTPFQGDVSLVHAHSHKVSSRHPLDAVWRSLAVVPWCSCSVQLQDSSDSDGEASPQPAQTAYSRGQGHLLLPFPLFEAADELSIKQLCNSANQCALGAVELRHSIDMDNAGGVAESKGSSAGFSFVCDQTVHQAVPAKGTEGAAIAINVGVSDACRHFTDATWATMQDSATALSAKRSGMKSHSQDKHLPRFASASSRPLQLFSREALLTMTESELMICLGATVAMIDRQERHTVNLLQCTAELEAALDRESAAIGKSIASGAPE